jgi:hypothetical protein
LQRCCYLETAIAASDSYCSISLADLESANLSTSQGEAGNSSYARILARINSLVALRKRLSWAFADARYHLSSAIAKIEHNHHSAELNAAG